MRHGVNPAYCTPNRNQPTEKWAVETALMWTWHLCFVSCVFVTQYLLPGSHGWPNTSNVNDTSTLLVTNYLQPFPLTTYNILLFSCHSFVTQLFAVSVFWWLFILALIIIASLQCYLIFLHMFYRVLFNWLATSYLTLRTQKSVTMSLSLVDWDTEVMSSCLWPMWSLLCYSTFE